MNTKISFLSLALFGVIIFACNNAEQQTKQDTNNNSKNQTSGSLQNSNEELAGGYSFEKNGRAELFIRKNGGNYYLQFRGSNAPEKEVLTKVSAETCSFVLGQDWQTKLISGLESGAFRVCKVKTGCIINGETINSGFYGGFPGAGQIWKVE